MGAGANNTQRMLEGLGRGGDMPAATRDARIERGELPPSQLDEYKKRQAKVDAEQPRNAKGWMAQRMAARVYRETTDQAAFSAVFDLDMAFGNSRSFRKLCSEWSKNVVFNA